MGRGLIAGLLVAILLDQGGSLMHGIVGAAIAVAIAAVFAPPRTLDRLRTELRASRIRGSLGRVRGVPIGQALTLDTGFPITAPSDVPTGRLAASKAMTIIHHLVKFDDGQRPTTRR